MNRIKRFDEKIILPTKVKKDPNVYYVIKVIEYKDPKDFVDGGQLGRDYIHPEIFNFENDADKEAQRLFNDKYKGMDLQIIQVNLKDGTSTTTTSDKSTTTEPETTTTTPETTTTTPEVRTETAPKKMPMDVYIKLKNQQQNKKLRQQNPQAFHKQMSVTSDLYSKYMTSKEKSDYLLSEIAKELKMDVSEMKDPTEVEMRIKSSKSQKLKTLIAELEKLYPKQLSSNYRPAPVIDSYTYTNKIMRFNEGIIAMAGTIAVILCGIAALRGVARNPVNQTGPKVEWFKIGKKSIPHPLKSAEQDKITYKKPYVEDPKTQLGSFFGTKAS